MSRAANWPPRVTRHGASGQDVVRFKGHTYYLGAGGSTASRRAYLLLIARLDREKPEEPAVPAAVTVGRVCAEWGPHALKKYGPENPECRAYEEALDLTPDGRPVPHTECDHGPD